MSGEFNTEVASVMIRQALEDLEATENKKYFEVDMGNWVSVQNKYLAEPKPLKLGPPRDRSNENLQSLFCRIGSVKQIS